MKWLPVVAWVFAIDLMRDGLEMVENKRNKGARGEETSQTAAGQPVSRV